MGISRKTLWEKMRRHGAKEGPVRTVALTQGRRSPTAPRRARTGEAPNDRSLPPHFLPASDPLLSVTASTSRRPPSDLRISCSFFRSAVIFSFVTSLLQSSGGWLPSRWHRSRATPLSMLKWTCDSSSLKTTGSRLPGCSPSGVSRSSRSTPRRGLGTEARRHCGLPLARLGAHLRYLATPGRNADIRAPEAWGLEGPGRWSSATHTSHQRRCKALPRGSIRSSATVRLRQKHERPKRSA
jgi:hypothetical protein